MARSTCGARRPPAAQRGQYRDPPDLVGVLRRGRVLRRQRRLLPSSAIRGTSMAMGAQTPGAHWATERGRWHSQPEPDGRLHRGRAPRLTLPNCKTHALPATLMATVLQTCGAKGFLAVRPGVSPSPQAQGGVNPPGLVRPVIHWVSDTLVCPGMPTAMG